MPQVPMVCWPALANRPPAHSTFAGRAPRRPPRRHAVAIGQALLVTFLWSTSWVFIKIGLDDLHLHPLSFAGLRYALAAAILLPFGIRALRRTVEPIGRGLALRVALYGLLFVAVTQGAQFAALAILPATAVSLVLSATPLAVAAIALARRAEQPTALQLLGLALLVAGAISYFGLFAVGPDRLAGLAIAAGCVSAAAVSAHIGRSLARDAIARMGGPLGLTAMSLGIGAVALLGTGLLIEGWPVLDLRAWGIVAWLAAVNTAFAFTLWNHTLRTLTAVESSVVNNTMTIQIAILAVIFLGERLAAGQVVGLVLAAVGAAAVQLAPILGRARTSGAGADGS
jgi:drug/metabolite transporter (DMT)-like permease